MHTSSYSQLHPHRAPIRPRGRDAVSQHNLAELALVCLELFSPSSVAHGWTSPLASTEYMMAPARYISAAMMNTTLHWSCRTLTSASGCKCVCVCVCMCVYAKAYTVSMVIAYKCSSIMVQQTTLDTTTDPSKRKQIHRMSMMHCSGQHGHSLRWLSAWQRGVL